MSSPDQNQPENANATMSPEVQAAFGKARRSFAFSMGIMLLGFMAVGFALVYRVMRDSPPPSVTEVVSLPAGAEVISAINTDGTVQVTYRAGENVMLSVFDAGSGELVRSIQIGSN